MGRGASVGEGTGVEVVVGVGTDVGLGVARIGARERIVGDDRRAALLDVPLEMGVGLVLDEPRVRHEQERIPRRRHLLAEPGLAEHVRLVPEELRGAGEVEIADVRVLVRGGQSRLAAIGIEIGDLAATVAQMGQGGLRNRPDLRMQLRLVGAKRIVVPMPDHDAGKPLEELGEDEVTELALVERLGLGEHVRGEDVALEAEPVLGLSKSDAEKRAMLESVEDRVKLEYETKHDYLTGLLTRQAFRDQAPSILKNEDSKFAIVFITLTKFYSVNRDKGYIFCDEYLKTFAEKIKKANTKGGINARIRGGTFAVLFEYEGSAEEESKRLFNELQGKYKGVPLTFSMGVATTECCGRGYEGLCITADAASKINADNGSDGLIIADNDFVDSLINQRGTEGDTI